MSFRKRNAVISTPASQQGATAKVESAPTPGVRPSPYDSRPTTSTGTSSLDSLLAGHAGLPLGISLLVAEHGTTDFAGVLLRYYAAEGMVQGHQVHVLGLHEGWRRDLPGVSTDTKSSNVPEAASGEKMKIAWRYEALASPGASSRNAEVQKRQNSSNAGSSTPFCHSFDLSKRLNSKDVTGQITFHPAMTAPQHPPKGSVFTAFIKDLSSKLANSPPNSIHRVIVPGLLSPTTYTGSSCQPFEVLQFLHGLRALLRRYATRLTAMITLPLTLYPRSSGLTRWIEVLCDSTLELIPLRSSAVHAPPPTSSSSSSSKSGSASNSEDRVQGLLKVHTLPVFDEKGGGSSESHEAREDQSFSLSRSRGLVIKPFSLPPVGDEEAEEKSGEAGKGMDF